jgi:hypothetical protein
MNRRARFLAAGLLGLVLASGSVSARGPQYTPGASGAGDPYYPLAGNGGYDVERYLLDITYNPATDHLTGTARIRALATQDLSRFNLDFDGLTVLSVTVGGKPASWERDGGELIVTPSHGRRNGRFFEVVVRYEGVPQAIDNEGWLHTADGAIADGEPHGASTWFPVNGHPTDKAAYTIKLTVPKDLEALSNGVLKKRRRQGDWTTWTWEAAEPMASYLATAAIGNYEVSQYSADGIAYWDAIASPLFEANRGPRTGSLLAVSVWANSSYKRLTRTISVPATGAQLSFWVTRETERQADFMFVEARTPGQDDWTTLQDANGHTTQDTGSSCPGWLSLHPFLAHYQTDAGDGTCTPSGTSGQWHAASGFSYAREHWSVDLGAWAGRDVEVSITIASNESVNYRGLYLDDIVNSAGSGSTSWEEDGDVLDGWGLGGAPPGSPGNFNDWRLTDEAPLATAQYAAQSLARQPEIVSFLSGVFGEYPFSSSGGIVFATDHRLPALETQTRPIYWEQYFAHAPNDSVVVHELAHQWAGNSVAVEQWPHIWLNEGFATYAEWLWSENQNLGTSAAIFDSLYDAHPDDDPFWSVIVGDPGPDALFAGAVYDRGAMTLHKLRVTVGDEAFFAILRTWFTTRAGSGGTTAQFIDLAEQICDQELSPLFDAWLFTAGKPAR